MEKENQLVVLTKQFEESNVEIILDENGEPLFELYSTGSALGYSRMVDSKGKKYFTVRKDRIDIIMKNAGITGFSHHGKTYLNEDMLYDFMLEAKTEKCKTFRKWVTTEVLPSIRQNGAYISNNITEEQEIKLDKYSTTRKIKNTFNKCSVELIDSEYKECMIYNKNKDGIEKNNIQKNIITALENRKEKMIEDGKGALALVVAEAINIIKKKQMETNNKSRGQKIAHKDKQINNLITQLNYYEPDEDEWIEIDVHPFSHNYMTKADKDWITGEPKIVKNDKYDTWQYKFPYNQLPEELNIDFSKRVCVWFRFIIQDKFDTTNMHKCILDTICKHYGVDDKNVSLMECIKIGSCDNYSDGKVYFAMRNQ